MLYAYQLCAQTNARYQESLVSLSQKEMRCMLNACGVAADIEVRQLGGAPRHSRSVQTRVFPP